MSREIGFWSPPVQAVIFGGRPGEPSSRWRKKLAALLFAALGAIACASSFAANEVGYWNNGAGALTSALFPDEYASPVTAANAYTATTGDAITAVRIGQSTGSPRVIPVALYEYDAGTNRPTGPALQTTSITTTGTGTFETTGLNWPLTNGLDYVLVAGDPDSVVNLTADTLTDGTSIDDSGDATFPTWGHTAYRASQIELAGDVTNSGGASNAPRARYHRRQLGFNLEPANDDWFLLRENQ